MAENTSIAIALSVLLFPAVAWSEPGEFPSHVTAVIDSDDTPECVVVEPSESPDHAMALFHIANHCEEPFRLRAKSCEVTECRADSGCGGVTCDGEWFTVARRRGAASDVGDVEVEDDGTRAGNGGDARAGSVLDASASRSGVEYRATYPLESTGIEVSRFREDDATVRVFFSWRLGDREEGTMGTRIFYVYSTGRDGSSVGCACDAADPNRSPFGSAAAVLLFAFGLLALRSRRFGIGE